MADILLTYPIPPIGSQGYFDILAPFTTQERERFTCIAIRRISEFISNNEDVFTDVYEANGLSQTIYEEQAAQDMVIATLVSEKGYRILVPVMYFTKYPAQDGVPYRRMGIHVTLPPVPVSLDLDFLLTKIKDVVTSSIGVTAVTSLIETSRVVIIPQTSHDLNQVNRDLATDGHTTDYSRVAKLTQDLLAANGKILELEAYILANP